MRGRNYSIIVPLGIAEEISPRDTVTTALIAKVTICAHLNELSAKYDKRSKSLSPSQSQQREVRPPHTLTHTVRGPLRMVCVTATP
jgi:hypothetical protein